MDAHFMGAGAQSRCPNSGPNPSAPEPAGPEPPLTGSPGRAAHGARLGDCERTGTPSSAGRPCTEVLTGNQLVSSVSLVSPQAALYMPV